jgi:hypothetical protein
MRVMRNAYKTLVIRYKGNRPFGRPRRKWEDNIRMDIKEVVWEDVDRMHMAQDRDQWRGLVNTAVNLQLP